MPDENDKMAHFAESMYAALLLTVIAEPNILDTFSKKDPNPQHNWENYKLLLDTEEAREQFANKVDEWINSLDWKKAESIMKTWGTYGWVLMPDIISVHYWESCPKSQEEADAIMMEHLDEDCLRHLFEDIVSISSQTDILNEAIQCFQNDCYTACASLLLSLVDGTLISSFANGQFENKKTGSNAGQRIIDATSKNYFFFVPGIFGFQSINFQAYISQLFERANNFSNEPAWVNRNFVHHGMSNRKIVRLDCIKLFLAYLQSIRFALYTTPAK